MMPAVGGVNAFAGAAVDRANKRENPEDAVCDVRAVFADAAGRATECEVVEGVEVVRSGHCVYASSALPSTGANEREFVGGVGGGVGAGGHCVYASCRSVGRSVGGRGHCVYASRRRAKGVVGADGEANATSESGAEEHDVVALAMSVTDAVPHIIGGGAAQSSSSRDALLGALPLAQLGGL